jgi:transcriptional regulator with XRE-family HTH domain
MSWNDLARELLRALRGRRSQAAFSRRLGYQSNVAHAWEGGRRFPTAAETLRAAQRTGIDVRGALARFFTVPPPWLERVEPTSPELVARLLGELKAGAPVAELAARSGCSRFAISRFLHGRAEPRLPDFLNLVETLSGRLPDLLAELVEPDALPSMRVRWQDLERRRTIASRHPWAQAVMRALETVAYRELPAHEPGWVARLLGLPIEEEESCLRALQEVGLVSWEGGRYCIGSGQLVDTRRHPEAGHELKMHWARVGLERLARGDEGMWSYNVFNVSREDLGRLRELHAEYFRTLRRAIAASEPLECVVVANVQLFELTSTTEPL